MRDRIGFIGLGIMGAPMARNLLSAGFAVTVTNRDPDKCAPLVALGAQIAGSPAEVTRSCDLTLCIVSDPQAALQVALGEQGAVAGLSAGKGYIDLSTVDPATAITIGAAVSATGAAFLECPVAGSRGPAVQGTLLMLAAGDQALFDRAAPVLDVLGKRSFFLGEVGNAARLKLINNMVMGVTLTALSEGLALADATGIAAEDLLAVLDDGAVSNPMFRLKGPLMACGESEPAFPLEHMQKDLRLALALGDGCALPLPLAAAANQRFLAGRAAGLSRADFSAVHQLARPADRAEDKG